MSIDKYIKRRSEEIEADINFDQLKEDSEVFWGKLKDFKVEYQMHIDNKINTFGSYCKENKRIDIYIYYTVCYIYQLIKGMESLIDLEAEDNVIYKQVIDWIINKYVESVCIHELYHAYSHKKLGAKYIEFVENDTNNRTEKKNEIETDENMVKYFKSRSELEGKLGELSQGISLNIFEVKGDLTKDEKIDNILREIIYLYKKVI